MKKTLVAGLIAMAFSGTAFAAADVTASNASVANIDFTGSVTSNSCQLSTSTVSQTVNLGEVKVDTLVGGGAGPRHNFSIDLVNCDATTSDFEVTFEDAQGYDANRDYIVNIANGDGTEAKGVGVMIAHMNNGAAVTLSSPETIQASVNTDGDAWPQQTLSFDAYLKGIDGETPTAGYVNAKATVSITTN